MEFVIRLNLYYLYHLVYIVIIACSLSFTVYGVVFTPYDDPCDNDTVLVGNTTGYKAIADQMNGIINFSIDPCADFYGFMCGKLVQNTSTPDFLRLLKVKNEEPEEIILSELKSGGKSGSKAIDQAKNLYKNCVKSLNDKKGTSGKQVMAAILSYGEFPTISKSQNTSIGDFDLTKLLVHFNRNRTVTPFLVPTVGLNKFNTSENIIKFDPRAKIHYLIGTKATNITASSSSNKLLRSFYSKIISLINGDIKGGTLNSSIVESDITDVLKFESKAESIFSSLSEIHQDPSSAKKAQLHRLSKVDKELKMMSWKTYLLLITPTELHKYIKADPVISVPSLDHIKRLNKLVLETKKRTLTNYVMLQHIKSLISMLQKKYNDAIDDFLTKSGQQKPTTEERCVALVRQKMPQVVGAVYVREVSEESVHTVRKNTGMASNGYEIKVAVDEIVAGIVEEFKRTLMNNIWMNNETKKAVLLKVDRMDRMVAYSDVLLDNKKLDDIHEHLLLAKPPPFLDMVDKMDNALSQDEFKSLLRNASRLNVYADMSSFDIYYDPSLNKLVVPTAVLQPPLFGRSFPRAYNYGTIGYMVAREMLHGFYNRGLNFDEEGNYVNWLSNETVTDLNTRTSCLAERLGRGGTGDWNRTLYEKVAASEGLRLALKAYSTYTRLNGMEPRLTELEEFTNDQMFFMGFMSVFCEENGMDKARLLLHKFNLDRHSMHTVVGNLPEFAAAFHCEPDMPLNPNERCSIW
ncbi:hypothetical protein RB195_011089 [Necator americanus]|uniref:Peptidase family M13 n=1 Tax=Necator americanus TaxID=51031 RepID=A0ABR1D1Z7_NECAM